MRKWITEGEIKASIATDILGEDVLSMPGTSMWRIATDVVMELDRVQEIVVAMDADYRRKAGVARALACIAADLLDRTQNGPIEISLGEWPEHLGKGLDDFLTANPGMKPTLRPITREVVAELQDLADRLAQEDADRQLAAGKMPVAADGEDDKVIAAQDAALEELVAEHFDDGEGGELAPAMAHELARDDLKALAIRPSADLLLDDAARRDFVRLYHSLGAAECIRAHIYPVTSDLILEIDKILERDASGAERRALAGYLGYDRTEMGFAQRMVARFRNQVLHAGGLGWHIWDGKRWVRDSSKKQVRVGALAQRVAMEIEAEIRMARICAGAGLLGPSVYAEAAQHISHKAIMMQDRGALGKAAMAEEEAHAKWVARTRNSGFLESSISLFQHYVETDYEQMDAHAHLLNTQSGIVDLRTGEIGPHDPAMMMTQITRSGCDPDAPRTRWEKFFAEVMAEADGTVDQEYVRYIQTYLGYSIWGLATEQRFCSVWGGGANGKTTLFETIAHIMGSYCKTIAPDLLIKAPADSSGNPRADILNLRGARIIRADEPERGEAMAEGVVKRLTGGDQLSARYGYSNEIVEFRIIGQFFMLCNSLLRISGTDHGIWRRQEVWNFKRLWRGQEDVGPEFEGLPLKDKGLGEALKAEADGILAWMVEGAVRWHQEGGLKRPKRVTDASKEYRGEQDRVLQFIEERVEIEDRRGNVVSQTEMYQAYSEWCRSVGTQPLARDRLKAALQDHHIQDGRNGPIGLLWKGVRLRPTPAAPYRDGQAGFGSGGGWPSRRRQDDGAAHSGGGDGGWQLQPAAAEPTRVFL